MKLFTTAALILSLLSPIASANTTLRIATIAPDGTSWMKMMREAADNIQKDTEGRVRVRYFPGGVQGSDKSVLRKMQIRQLQGGAVSTGALSDITNVSQIYNLPFTFRNWEEVHAVRSEFDPYIAKALADKGYILLGLSEGGFAYLMSNSPLQNSEEVRSKKVWSPEGDVISQTIFESGKVNPISLPISDVYTSLQTGLIDTIGANLSSSIALQWHTKIKDITDFPLLFLFGALVVDQRAFDTISAEDQVIVRKHMKNAFAAMDRQNIQDERSARQALIDSGIRFVDLNEQNKDDWHALAVEAMSKLRAQNVYPVELYEKLKARLETLRSGE